MKKLLTVTLGALAGLALLIGGAGAAHASAGEAGTPATFRGTVNGYDDHHSVYLRPGLVVVRARHAGTRNFSLDLVQPEPGKPASRSTGPSVSLINHAGPYNGGAAGQVQVAGLYALDIYASGSYEITVEQPPVAAIAPVGQRDFSGQGQQVTPVIMMPAGARHITFTHDGVTDYGSEGLAQVFLLDMNGETVSGDISGRLFQETGPYSDEVTLEVILDEPHIFHVKATGAWTLHID